MSMFFIIEKFNNWASFDFIIGTVLVFILLLYGGVVQEEYKKGERLYIIRRSVTGDLTIPMMAGRTYFSFTTVCFSRMVAYVK